MKNYYYADLYLAETGKVWAMGTFQKDGVRWVDEWEQIDVITAELGKNGLTFGPVLVRLTYPNGGWCTFVSDSEAEAWEEIVHRLAR